MLRRIINVNNVPRAVGQYLDRINYNGPLEPNLKNLARLTWAQKTSVPYTNIDYVSGTRINLDRKKMYEKLIINKQGGLCHEMNGQFSWLLQQLGYDVSLFSSCFYLDHDKKWSKWGGHSFACVSCFFIIFFL